MYRSRSTPWPNEELICTNTLVLRSARRARPCWIKRGANDIQQFAIVRRFLQESGGARFQRALAIELRIARGQDNYGNRRERRSAANDRAQRSRPRRVDQYGG